MNGPRKMTAYLPSFNTAAGELTVFRQTNEDEDILYKYNKVSRAGISKLINKPPKWSPENDAFVLDFYDRVKKASVKNFQLINELDEDFILLQFGKVEENIFSMDFQWPMTPAQAFAICLSSLDNKLMCE